MRDVLLVYLFVSFMMLVDLLILIGCVGGGSSEILRVLSCFGGVGVGLVSW